MPAYTHMQRAQPILAGHAMLVVLSFVYVLPFAWLVTTSLQPDAERSKIPPAFVPAPPAADPVTPEQP